MLSICIPVYNVDVRELVEELSKQFTDTKLDGEIIVLDDGSNNHFRNLNKDIISLKAVRYYEQFNHGRSITRNKLVEYAKYDKIAFIDSDCIVSSNYLFNYCQPKSLSHQLVIGGLAYDKEKPDRNLRLRWNYGRKRESTIRYNENSISFLSSNFVIDRKLFNSIKFDERIKGYGNEDTLFGILLRRRQIPFYTINNKVIHKGIEPADIFLSKTKESLSNLWYIYKNTKYIELESHKAVKILKSKQPSILIKLLDLCYKLTERPIAMFLSKVYPSIFIFDVYKMLYLFHYKQTYDINQ
ncbi:glycosyltransferase family 2 protein [Carboxylicivirga sediminis]|uniref:Glycosyltransferase family 2 protein n=1 Tax=Carboxylicivirga sediminis TaxID=2006564 RepID=A0A941IZ29_9BACT|nr:glycosyltransferase [Carboxylicivirga sediminis]MBR8537600.1 glycosyltransferase family 2 protein [Carboxylicivirga sediminis]